MKKDVFLSFTFVIVGNNLAFISILQSEINFIVKLPLIYRYMAEHLNYKQSKRNNIALKDILL